MTHLQTLDYPVRVTVADGRSVHITTVGRLTLSVMSSYGARLDVSSFVVANVYYVPTLSVTLPSVSQLVRSGYVVRFRDNMWSVCGGRHHANLLQTQEIDGVYEVVTPDTPAVSQPSYPSTFATIRTNISLTTWHRRLGHLNLTDCRRLAESGAVTGVVISASSTPPTCRACALAKVSTATAPASRSSSPEVAAGVCHMDLSGPVHKSYHGSEYFMVAVWRDYIRVYGLRTKDEASVKAADFLRFIARQAQVNVSAIKTIRTDGGTEFMGSDFRKLVSDEGLRHQHSTRYRSSQNGVAERSIRTLTEMAAAILIDSHLPHYLWEDALQHAAYIRNRVPKRGAQVTPHERLFGSKPSLAHLPIFGQTLVVRTPDPIRRKAYRFDGRGTIGAFIGFTEEIRGYRVYVPGDARPIKETTDVILLDSMLLDEVVLEDESAPPKPEELPPTVDTSVGTRSGSRAADRLQDTSWSQDAVERENGTSDLTRRRRSERLSARGINAAFMTLTEVIREPLTIAEARRSDQWPAWEQAIRTELDALKSNGTYDLVEPPPGAHILGNTIQFRVKTGPTGEIVQFKARVCARGDKQVFLLDYIETRAPVADLICVRIFFIIACKYRMTIRQGDVPAAYLKAALKEVVYVRQVKGFEAPGQEHKVWRLNKALYGLKQAGRAWNREIDAFLKSYGLTPTTGDACLYFMWVANGLLLVCLYVDDILIAHPDEEQVLRLMVSLNVKYSVKDLGDPAQFLGVRVENQDQSIQLSQAAYVAEVLHRFAMDPVRPASTPMVPNTRLDTATDPTEDEQRRLARVPFREVVGSLLYLARISRPDIMFAVTQLARHCASPTKIAWDAAKYLLRYLSGTRELKLRLKPDQTNIQVVTDADFANDRVDRKSVSGYFVYLFGAPVAWGSVKQSVVALSSTAAEFIAANDGLAQAEWIQLVTDEIFAAHAAPIPLTLTIDSIPAIHRIKREGSSNAQKAVDIRFHALKDLWLKGAMTLEYVSTGDNVADLLTKALPHTQLRYKRGLCGLL